MAEPEPSTPPNPLRRRAALLGAFLILAAARAGFGPSGGFDLELEIGGTKIATTEPPPFARTFAEYMNATTGPLSATYRGILRIKYPGTYHFEMGAAGSAKAALTIDGKPMAGTNAGEAYPWHSMREFQPGLYPAEIAYRRSADDTTSPGLTLQWAKDIDAFRPVPSGVIYRAGTRGWQFALSRLLLVGIVILAIALLSTLGEIRVGTRRMRRIYFASAAAGMGILFTLVILEIGLRLVRYKPRRYVPGNIWFTYKFHDPGTTTLYKGYLPAQPQEFEVPVTTNTIPPHGWRDVEVPYEKPEGTFRIEVVGDSYVEGKEVPLEDTFTKRLGALLNSKNVRENFHYEALALGKGGCSTGKQIEFLDEPGARFHPDWVILSVFPGNDIRENDGELTGAFELWSNLIYREKVIPARIAFIDRTMLCQSSYLNHFITDRGVDLYTSLLPRLRSDLSPDQLISPDLGVWRAGPYPPEWERAWTETEAYILTFAEKVKAMGARLTIMLVYSPQLPGAEPERMAKAAGLDLDRPYSRLAEFCKAHDLDCLNLKPILLEKSKEAGEPYSWKYDAHWNALGHKIAADALFHHLEPEIHKQYAERP